MKQLEKTFIGKGEVKGFSFTQLKNNGKAYIYEVSDGNFKHYEVFKHKENTQFKCVSYPRSKSFGIWAYSVSNLNRAIEIFEEITIQKEVQNGI